jgi:glycosyltransferase involved in cell wall biosynthesis
LERKNILFISSWFPSKVQPSNGNFVQRHAEAVALRHDVEILHSIGDFNQGEKYIFNDQVVNGIRTLIVYYRNSKNPVKNFYRRMKAYKMGFSIMKKPDLVHANVLHNSMLFAVYLKKKFRIPFVVTEHWTAFQADSSDSSGLFGNQIAKYIGNHASMIFPVCDRLRKGLCEIGIKTKAKVIPNVVDTHIFRSKKGENTVRKFLHISSLTYMKNIPSILNVFLKVHEIGYDFELSLGGNGDLKPIKEFIAQHKLEHKIKYFGAISHNEVAKKMRQNDAFVLFSKYENQPCVISESISVGLYVLSSNVGGISEFFPEGFGTLVQKDNEEELCNAIINYLQNNVKVASNEEMHQYAINTFGKDAIAAKYGKSYIEILGI